MANASVQTNTTNANNNTTNSDESWYAQQLTDLNNAEIHRLLPLTTYLLLLMVVGIPGNAMVFHIYRTQYKRSNSRYFILCLSTIDFFTCLFVVPFELFTLQNQYTYTATVTCKISRFCTSAPTVANGFMFLLIAIDRYRKVCKPLRWQIRPKTAKMLCVGTVVCGVLFSWPVLILYGKKTFTVERLNITASECSIADSMTGTIYPFVHNSILGFLFIVGSTTLVTLYAIIGKAINKHAKDIVHFQSNLEMKNLRDDTNDNDYSLSGDDFEKTRKVSSERSNQGLNNKRATASSSIGDQSDVFIGQSPNYPVSNTTLDRSTEAKKNKTERSVSFVPVMDNKDRIYKKSPNRSISLESGKHEKEQGGENKLKSSAVWRKISSIGSRINLRSSSDTDSSGTPNNRKRSVSQKIRQQRTRKMSFIMFLITLAYIASYLPHVSLMLTRALTPDFVDSMSDVGRAVYKFFLRSYFFNCVVNPFIYSACDVRFRNGVKHFFQTVLGGICKKT